MLLRKVFLTTRAKEQGLTSFKFWMKVQIILKVLENAADKTYLARWTDRCSDVRADVLQILVGRERRDLGPKGDLVHDPGTLAATVKFMSVGR